MRIGRLEVFPTLFYVFDFSQDQIIPICKEIAANKTEIKKRYLESDSSTDAKIDYWTDYNNPIKLFEYEKLIEEIGKSFLPEMYCEHIEYWTAIYEEMGYHGMHNHNPMLYDFPICNMSSILYLSDIGRTEFFNPKLDGVTYQTYNISSQLGRMVMFPSHVLHTALPHGKKEGRPEKIIISSNWSLRAPPGVVRFQHQKTMIKPSKRLRRPKS